MNRLKEDSTTRDLQGLLDVLTPQVVLISDGGGVRQAAPRPITGADKVDPTMVNGNPALVVRLDGEVDGILAIRVEDTRNTGLYDVRNPQKLTRFESETPLTLR